jgi:uncharacterized protein with PQ loop repeat
MGISLIGWLSAAVLLGTLVVQLHAQWRERSTAAISRWLFAGQALASIGFIVYSALVHDAVFVTASSLIFIAAIIAQLLVFSGRRRDRRRQPSRVVVRISRRQFRSGRARDGARVH